MYMAALWKMDLGGIFAAGGGGEGSRVAAVLLLVYQAVLY